MHNLDSTGQHYMIDKDLIKFIVDSAGLAENDVVLEIGYGKGALTRELVKHCRVIAIDIKLHELDFIDHKLHIVEGNILDKFEQLESEYRFNKIVANIPYNISEPLMRKIFTSNVESCIICIGKNFADLIASNDNRIGIIANHLYNIKVLKSVQKKSFYPMPSVDSAIISIKKKEPDWICAIYKSLVIQDDKKLKNALEKILSDKTKREVRTIAGAPLFGKRFYELSNDESVELDKVLLSLGTKDLS